MALNFGGLGLVISAADKGADRVFKGVSRGIDAMYEQCENLSDWAKKSTDRFEKVFEPFKQKAIKSSTDAMQSLTEGVQKGVTVALDRASKGAAEFEKKLDAVSETSSKLWGQVAEGAKKYSDQATAALNDAFQSAQKEGEGIISMMGGEKLASSLNTIFKGVSQGAEAVQSQTKKTREEVGLLDRVSVEAWWDSVNGIKRANDALETFSGKLAGSADMVTKLSEAANKRWVAETNKQREAAKAAEELAKTTHKTETEEEKAAKAAEDRGEKTRGMFSKLGDAIGKMGDKTKEVGASIVEWFGDRARRAAESLGGSVTQAMTTAQSRISSMTAAQSNLTTAYEAQQQQLSQGARRLGANYGFLGSSLRSFAGQAAGMAYGMNIGVEAAGQAVYAYRSAGTELRAVGLGSARLMAMFANVTGQNAEQLGNNLRGLRTEFQFTDEDLRTVMGSAVHFGRTSGNVGSAVGNLSEVITQLRAAAVQSGQSMDSHQLAQYASGINQASTAFYSLTQNAEVSRSTAMQLSQALLQGRRQMGDLFAGTAEDIPQLAQSLAVGTGDVRHAFELMQQGPAGFMQGMSQMVRAARANGAAGAAAMNHLRAQLDTALGPETTNMLMSFMDRASDAQIASMTTATGAVDDLRRVAREGFSTGLTTQDAYNRMRDSFIAGFRSIGRAATGEFMRNTSRGLNEFRSALSDIAHEGGPLGRFVTLMSEASSIGSAAFLPARLQGVTQGLSAMFDAVKPGLEAMKSLGFSLRDVFSVGGLLGTGLALLGINFVSFFMQTRSVGQALDMTVEMISKFADKVAAFAGRLPELAAKYIPQVVAVLGRLLPALGQIATTLGNALVRLLETIGPLLVQFVGSFDWGGLFSALFRGVIGAATTLIRFAGTLAATLFRVLVSALSQIDFAAIATQLFQALGESLAQVVGVLRGLDLQRVLGGLFEGIVGALAGAVSTFLPLLGQLLPQILTLAVGLGNQILSGIVRLLPTVVTALTGLISQLVPTLGTFLSGIVGMIARLLPGLVEMLATAVPELLQNLVSLVATEAPRLVGVLVEALMGVVDMIARPSFLDSILRLVESLLTGIIRGVSALVPAIVGVITRILPIIPRLIQTLVPLVLGLVTRIIPVIARLVGELGQMIGRLLPQILPPLFTALQDLFRQLVALGPVLGPLILRAIPEILSAVGQVFNAIFSVARDWVLGLMDMIRQYLVDRFPQYAGTINAVFAGVRSFVTGVFSAIQTVVTNLFTAISGAVSVVSEVLIFAFNGLMGMFTNLANFGRAFAETWVEVWGGIKLYAADAWGWINTNVVMPLRSAFESAGDFINEHFGGVIDSIRQKFDEMIGGIRGGIESARSFIEGLIPGRRAAATPSRVMADLGAAGTTAATSVAAAREQIARLQSSLEQAGRAGDRAAQTEIQRRMEIQMAALRQMRAAVPPTAAAVAPPGRRPAGPPGPVTPGAVPARPGTPGAVPALGGLPGGAAAGLGAAVPSPVILPPRGRPGATAEEVGAAVTTTMTQVTQTFTQGMTTGLREAFQTGFTDVLNTYTTRFTPQMLTATDRLAKNIRLLLSRLLTDVLEATTAVFANLNTQVERLASFEARIASVGAQATAAQQAAQTVVGGRQVTAEDVRRRLGGRDATNNDIVAAIDAPAWYTDYANRFEQGIRTLATEIRSSRGRAGGTAPVQGTAGANPPAERAIAALAGTPGGR